VDSKEHKVTESKSSLDIETRSQRGRRRNRRRRRGRRRSSNRRKSRDVKSSLSGVENKEHKVTESESSLDIETIRQRGRRSRDV